MFHSTSTGVFDQYELRWGRLTLADISLLFLDTVDHFSNIFT